MADAKEERVETREAHPRGFLEQCITPWNGALYSRGHLLHVLTQANWSEQAIVFWVFQPEALSTQAIAQMYASGFLINTVPNVFPNWYCEEWQ